MDHAASTCEECMNSKSVFHCIECEQSLCSPCDFVIHRGGKRKGHKRQGLCYRCHCHATQHCSTCIQNLCRECQSFHLNHTISPILTQNYIAVFWDLNSQKIITGEEILQTLASVKNLYSRVDIFKVYGDSYFKWKHLFSSTQADYSHPEGIRESEAILIDISLLSKDRVAEILLISSKASSFKAHLNQIQSGMPKIKIFISLSFPELQALPLTELPTDVKASLVPPKLGLIKPLSGDFKAQDKANSDHFPVYQNFSRKKGQNMSHDHLLTYLKELSDSGLIMHDSSWLCKAFAQRARLSVSQSTNIIKELESLGHIHTTERVFCDLKTMFFTSLKIEGLSFESLLWALRSLKVDEMLPTERAIQSRIKEAFDFKVSPSEWSFLQEVIRGMHKHTHTKSAPEQINYSLFSSASTPVFILKEALDPVTRSKIFVIYPKGEEWDSIDQFIKEGDVLEVKQNEEWQAFVSFLTGYFSVNDPDSRAIPGGRYGCAQFLKFCGNQVLRNCSLGKLSYMVQLSIDEDLLRYHKTLLIWTPISPKPVVDSLNSEKLAIIQGKIIEVLKENRDGMSLAQLPLYVKRKLTFQLNITELGFAKLKDLLLVMPEVEVEQRGNNHPFAVYRPRRKVRESEVKRVIEDEVKETGTEITKIEKSLQTKLGQITWTDFRVTGLEEFILKKTDLLMSWDKKILTKDLPRDPFEKRSQDSTTDDFSLNTHKYDYFDPFMYNPPGFTTCFTDVFADTDGIWNLLGQTGFSGEIVVNETTGSSLFYMMFQSVAGSLNTDTRPLVIWLPGGPGCSLGLGMFGQRYSPFFVDSNGLPHFNNLTWALYVHILSIDFPYGVGYSSPTVYSDWVLKVSDGVSVFINFIDKLMKKYPSWFNRDLYLVGQDYAGLFIPAIVNQIHINNRNLLPGHPGFINLAGVLLGDAWINGEYQSAYYDVFAFNQGLANRVQKDRIALYENYIIGNSTIDDPDQAFISYQNLLNYIESVSGNVNTYNYRSYSPDDLGNLDDFFNNVTNKLEFNVPSDITWTACSQSVFSNLTDSLFVGQSQVLSTVLNYYRVLIYSSQDDLIINSLGTQTVIRGLNWLGISDFLSARRGVWRLGGNIAGYAQSSTNLTYVQILKSGLGIGLDQTAATRDMLYRFIFNQGWN